MKQKLSTAALALQLTTVPAILLFLVTGALQWGLFAWNLPEDPVFASGFADLLAICSFPGAAGTLLLPGVLFLSTVPLRGSNFRYTLDRMGSRGTVAFGLVFAGWMMLYWVFQTILMQAIYLSYEAQVRIGDIGFLLAAYRFPYLHILIPLRDVWGYARNLSLCLAFGMTVSWAADRFRHRHYGCTAIPVLFWLFCLVMMKDQPATMVLDIILTVCAAILTLLPAVTRRWEADYEEF